MTRTYAQLQKQIAKLQEAAEALKAREVAGVVDRIKVAIKHYGLTADDLFGSLPAATTKRAGAVRSLVKASGKKRPSAPKYRDSEGNTWTGNGKRPRWFLAAIESGKSPKDLEIDAGSVRSV